MKALLTFARMKARVAALATLPDDICAGAKATIAFSLHLRQSGF